MSLLCTEKDYLKKYKGFPDSKFFLVEELWGHRFKDDQTPNILLQELLFVLKNQFLAKEKGKLDEVFSMDERNQTLYFSANRCLKKRFLLYQNDYVHVVQNSNKNNEEKWNDFFSYLKKHDGRVEFSEEDCEHIKTHCRDFDTFYRVLGTLSNMTDDADRDRRWTSKFVFPVCSELLWNDLGKKLIDDRRFFARGGQLVYLMLCRVDDQKLRNQLESLFKTFIFPEDSIYSTLAKAIADEEDGSIETKDLGYLPIGYRSMICFNNFAEDLIKILSSQLEVFDKIKILTDLVGFYVGHYIYSVPSLWDKENNHYKYLNAYLAEVLSNKNNSLRKYSMTNKKTKPNLLTTFAREKAPLIANKWDISQPEDVINEVLENALFKTQLLNVPEKCFKEIGFLSFKNTNQYRYMISEEFLFSLVMTILGDSKRIELRKFIGILQERYSIYINQVPNPDEKEQVLQEDLNKNAKRLTIMLYQMGMLRQLSDACSYVINPYTEECL